MTHHDERASATGPDARPDSRYHDHRAAIRTTPANRDLVPQPGRRIYISGRPGRRGWYANVVAHPDFVFHLKETAKADIPARAHPITDPAERHRVLSGLLAGIGCEGKLDDWVDRSPLIEMELLVSEDAMSQGHNTVRRSRHA